MGKAGEQGAKRTDFAAETAVNAKLLIDNRIEEALLIRLHSYGSVRTLFPAGAAAVAVLFAFIDRFHGLDPFRAASACRQTPCKRVRRRLSR